MSEGREILVLTIITLFRNGKYLNTTQIKEGKAMMATI
jgi:hypothetical protein